MILPEKLGRMVPIRLTERWFNDANSSYQGLIGVEIVLVCHREDDPKSRWYSRKLVLTEEIDLAHVRVIDLARNQMFDEMRRA